MVNTTPAISVLASLSYQIIRELLLMLHSVPMAPHWLRRQKMVKSSFSKSTCMDPNHQDAYTNGLPTIENQYLVCSSWITIRTIIQMFNFGST